VFAIGKTRNIGFALSLKLEPTIFSSDRRRLTEVKNHELSYAPLRCLRMSCQSWFDRAFVIVGDGALRKALERQAQSLGVTADVYLRHPPRP